MKSDASPRTDHAKVGNSRTGRVAKADALGSCKTAAEAHDTERAQEGPAECTTSGLEDTAAEAQSGKTEVAEEGVERNGAADDREQFENDQTASNHHHHH